MFCVLERSLGVILYTTSKNILQIAFLNSARWLRNRNPESYILVGRRLSGASQGGNK
jgi:hypothetical protein